MIWIVLGVLGVLLSIAVTVAPATFGIIYSRRRTAWNKAFLARAVRTRGTVVEVPAFLTGGANSNVRMLETAPIVSYVAPDGTQRQARVKVASASMYTYGQPVDLLVDPAAPDQVVLAAHANDLAQSSRLVVMSLLLSTMVGLLVFMLWIGIGAIGFFGWAIVHSSS